MGVRKLESCLRIFHLEEIVEAWVIENIAWGALVKDKGWEWVRTRARSQTLSSISLQAKFFNLSILQSPSQATQFSQT